MEMTARLGLKVVETNLDRLAATGVEMEMTARLGLKVSIGYSP